MTEPEKKDTEQKSGRRRADDAFTLAKIYTIGFLLIATSLVFFEVPSGNKEIVLQVMSIMSAIQLGIIAYFYGASKQTEQTQAVMAAQADKAVEAVAAATAAATTPKEGT